MADGSKNVLHGQDGPIQAYSLKLAPFWKGNPVTWFLQAEAQFRTKGLTLQKTKFDYIIGAIDPEIANDVIGFLINPPAENAYDAKKLKQVLSLEKLGDRTPKNFFSNFAL